MVSIHTVFPSRVEKVSVLASEGEEKTNLARAKAIDFLGRLGANVQWSVRVQAYLLCPECADTKKVVVKQIEHGRNVILHTRACFDPRCEPELFVDETFTVLRTIFEAAK